MEAHSSYPLVHPSLAFDVTLGDEAICSDQILWKDQPGSPTMLSIPYPAGQGVRHALEKSPAFADKAIDPAFSDSHLNPCSFWTTFYKAADDDTFIDKIKETTTQEKPIYEGVTGLLNAIKSLPPSRHDPDPRPHPIVFLDHSANVPTQHPRILKDRPDILAVTGPLEDWAAYKVSGTRTDYHGVPYPSAHAIVEGKALRGGDGRAQASTYAWQVLEARPDLVGLYCLSVSPTSYQIQWVDAAGVVASPLHAWDDLEPLVKCLYSLYIPPKGHYLRDVSISLNIPSQIQAGTALRPPKASVTFDISCSGSKPVMYKGCRLRFMTNPFGKRVTIYTWHGIDLDSDSKSENLNFAAIKDSFHDSSRRFTEHGILHIIHRQSLGTRDASFFPGVVRLLDLEDVKLTIDGVLISISTAPRKIDAPGEQSTSHAVPIAPEPGPKPVHSRIKQRLQLGSTGTHLWKAKTVKDILLAIYDLLEVHRTVVAERDVLHRDLNVRNVLMYPVHSKKTGATNVQVDFETRPKFIDEILESVPSTILMSNIDRSRALVLDWDNGAVLSLTASSHEVETVDLAYRTGSPGYIARAVADGRHLSGHTAKAFVPMPSLYDKAKDMYIQSHSQVRYDQYRDHDQTFHGGKISPDPKPAFSYRPDHDAESAFWLLFRVLLTSTPECDNELEVKGATRRIDLVKLATRMLDTHSINGLSTDPREGLLNWSVEQKREALHPKLANVATLLDQIALQVTPEYALLTPSPRQEHLHEAFQRLLLAHIVDMDNPINLRVPIHRDEDVMSPQVWSGSSRKRGLAETEDAEEHPSKILKEDINQPGLGRYLHTIPDPLQ